MWYQVSVIWDAAAVPDNDATAAAMLQAMTPWHAAVITPPTTEVSGWGTTVSVNEDTVRQAVATALVAVTSTARSAGGMSDVVATEVHARPQPTPPPGVLVAA